MNVWTFTSPPLGVQSLPQERPLPNMWMNMWLLFKAQAQSTAEACQQNWYYDQKIGTMNLKPVDLVLVKADTFKGKRKIRDRWEEDTCKLVHQIMTDIPSYEVTDQCRWSDILLQNWLLLLMSEVGIPLCIGLHHAQDICTSPTPMQVHFQR